MSLYRNRTEWFFFSTFHLGLAANWTGMTTQQAAMLGGGGQAMNDPRAPISMQQSSWNGQPMMNSAEMGATGGAGSHLGPGINPTYGNTGIIPGAHAEAMGGGMMSGGGLTYQAGDFGSVLRVMNAERMQAEGELREDEDQQMKELSQQQVTNNITNIYPIHRLFVT